MSKKKIREYFKDNWDVTLDQIVGDFKIPPKDIPKLQQILDTLIEEGWVVKSYCAEHDTDEYDPGENYGVWS
ncbi:MAG: hypothetical protein Q7R82_02360 [Candidatus Daviesbacteria bacterium]|nr:hypothetical protein [Candidatus Daviesbacteria bacterium]